MRAGPIKRGRFVALWISGKPSTLYYLSHAVARSPSTYMALSPFKYSFDCLHPKKTKDEKDRVIQTVIIIMDNGRTWIKLSTSLNRKMTHYRPHSSDDGFIIRPSYIDIYIYYCMHFVL